MSQHLQRKIKNDVRKWSEEFLEIPNKHLGGFPACPFAKKTWKDDKVVMQALETHLRILSDGHDYFVLQARCNSIIQVYTNFIGIASLRKSMVRCVFGHYFMSPHSHCVTESMSVMLTVKQRCQLVKNSGGNQD